MDDVVHKNHLSRSLRESYMIMAATICFTSAILGKQKGTPLCVYIGQVPFGTLITSRVLIFAIFCGPENFIREK